MLEGSSLRWNEWYGAVVTIHACSFTSLSPPHTLSLSVAVESFLGDTTHRGRGNRDKQIRERRKGRLKGWVMVRDEIR